MKRWLYPSVRKFAYFNAKLSIVCKFITCNSEEWSLNTFCNDLILKVLNTISFVALIFFYCKFSYTTIQSNYYKSIKFVFNSALVQIAAHSELLSFAIFKFMIDASSRKLIFKTKLKLEEMRLKSQLNTWNDDMMQNFKYKIQLILLC